MYPASFRRARASWAFPATIPKLGRSQRSIDHRRYVAEMFFACWAKAVRNTLSGAQRVQKCGTHLLGWASRPSVVHLGSTFASRLSAHPTKYGFGEAVCAIACGRSCRQSSSARWTSATIPETHADVCRRPTALPAPHPLRQRYSPEARKRNDKNRVNGARALATVHGLRSDRQPKPSIEHLV